MADDDLLSPPPVASPVTASAGAGVPVAQPVSPLSEAQFAFLRHAMQVRRPLRRAARVAHSSAVSILIVGVGSIPFTLLSLSADNILATVLICAIGYLELLGARKMARGEPGAASHLGWNQVVFICLIVIYCANAMLDASRGASFSPQARQQLDQVGIGLDIESMVTGMTYVVYSAVIFFSVLLQGGLALYYFTRRRMLEACRQSTPAWIQRLIDEVSAT